MSILAWGNAPGLRQKKFTSADSAIHLRVFFDQYGVEFDERSFDLRFTLPLVIR
jgi:hypothetical protein